MTVTGLPWRARHATPVDDLDTSGARQVAAVAAMLGTPLMPWQHVAARILEARHPTTGRLAHPFAVLTVPRQAGKSTLLLAVLVKRALLDGSGRRLWYTAQNGNAAAEKWAELARILCSPETPLAGRVAARWTNGSQALTFPNGSTLRPFAPTRDSLHGKQSHTVVIDEGFAFDAVRGIELLQAVGPTQAAQIDPQTVVVSTQGDALSTWLHGLIDRGRAAAPGIAYLEYGIGDDGDGSDLDAVAAAHPAVGHTITRAFLEHQALILDPLEFARAYGNARTSVGVRVIDPRSWAAAATTRLLPDGPITLAADVALDRSRAAIVACRLGVLEVIESRDGTEWVGPRMVEIAARHNPAAVAVQRVGPAGILADHLDRFGVPVTAISAGDYATACAAFLADVEHGHLTYRMHPNLDAAAGAAARRPVGDGGWIWSRRHAAAPICELVAATLAAWLDQHRPAAAAHPLVYSG